MRNSRHNIIQMVYVKICTFSQQFSASSYRFGDNKNSTFFTFKFKVTKCNFRCYTVGWKISKMDTCLPHIFALPLTTSEIYKLKIFNLKNIAQGHGVQFSQRHHSIANVKFYKCYQHIFHQLLPFQRYHISNNFLKK